MATSGYGSAGIGGEAGGMRVCVCTPVAVDGPVLLRDLGVLAEVVDNTAVECGCTSRGC